MTTIHWTNDCKAACAQAELDELAHAIGRLSEC